MYIGCHVSIAGGIFKAPQNAVDFGCEVAQVFTRSPQGGPAPKLTKEILALWNTELEKSKLHEIAVHAPYFINFASANPRIKNGSASIIREELDRASLIGASYLMAHLGSSKDVERDVAEQLVIDGLLKALDGYKGSTTFCIEIAAGSGNVLGASFEEVGRYIVAIEKKDKRLKNKLGVCFDTCHAFASGYDLRDTKAVNATAKLFDQHIGLDRLKLVHANDSKFDLAEKKDRHDHLGKGKIGAAGFTALAKHPAFKKVNWYLETEHDAVKKDIAFVKKIR